MPGGGLMKQDADDGAPKVTVDNQKPKVYMTTLG